MRNLPDAKYGENSQFQALQQGASLSASPNPQGQAPSLDQGALPPNPAAGQVVPFSAPTTRPNEPVTSGASLGAGPGITAMGSSPAQVEQGDMGKISASLPLFEMLANMNDALPSTRLFVNLLRGGTQ